MSVASSMLVLGHLYRILGRQFYVQQDYGSWRTVHVCVYLDDGVSREQAASLMSDWTTKDAVGAYYRMDVVPEGFWRLRVWGSCTTQ